MKNEQQWRERMNLICQIVMAGAALWGAVKIPQAISLAAGAGATATASAALGEARSSATP